MDQPTVDETHWPSSCPFCGTELAQATIELDEDRPDRPALNPGEMAQVDYCPNPDCPSNAED